MKRGCKRSGEALSVASGPVFVMEKPIRYHDHLGDGTLIRHAPSFAVLALPVAMIEPSFRALLVPPVGTPPLTAAGELAALSAAITMPSITV